MKDDRNLLEGIEKQVFSIPIVDTHEHLISEEERRIIDPDIFFLFSHYTSTDIVSSGMPEETYLKLSDSSISEEERWKLFEKYWPAIRNTNYSRIVLEAVKDLYGFDDINSSNYKDISRKVRETKNKQWYDKILSEKCRIKYVLNFIENIPDILDTSPVKRPDIVPVKNFVDIISVCCREDILGFEKKFNTSIYNLKGYLEMIDRIYDDSIRNGYKALKIVIAYMRDIYFEDRTFWEADRVFARLFKLKDYGFLEKKDFLSKDDLRPLQDFLVHYIIQKAASFGLPVQIHSGLLDGNLGNITGSNPAFLVNLFLKYRNCRFDIFHAGYPYSDILISICKQFPNVFFNLCWIHEVSANLYSHILDRVCQILPSSKVFGFGGDYKIVECIYGAQKIARRAIVSMLYRRISEKYFTFEEGIEYAQKILYENPLSFYGLKE